MMRNNETSISADSAPVLASLEYVSPLTRAGISTQRTDLGYHIRIPERLIWTRPSLYFAVIVEVLSFYLWFYPIGPLALSMSRGASTILWIGASLIFITTLPIAALWRFIRQKSSFTEILVTDTELIVTASATFGAPPPAESLPRSAIYDARYFALPQRLRVLAHDIDLIEINVPQGPAIADLIGLEIRRELGLPN